MTAAHAAGFSEIYLKKFCKSQSELQAAMRLGVNVVVEKNHDIILPMMKVVVDADMVNMALDTDCQIVGI